MATTSDVVTYLQENVNWVKFFSVIDTLGRTMNAQKDRMDKSDVIEMALETFSEGAVRYMNNDGVDHILVNLPDSQNKPTTQEMKFGSGCFYKQVSTERANRRTGNPGKKKLVLADRPVTLKLINSMGSNTHASMPRDYAEFLLVVDNNSAFVIEVADLGPYLNYGGDGIEAQKVPANLFTKVVGPEDVVSRKPLNNFNYKEEKLKFQRDFLNKFN